MFSMGVTLAQKMAGKARNSPPVGPVPGYAHYARHDGCKSAERETHDILGRATLLEGGKRYADDHLLPQQGLLEWEPCRAFGV